MNVSLLYPQVHDLTQAEKSAMTSSTWCGDTSFLWTDPPSCFSLNDLVNPTFSAMSFSYGAPETDESVPTKKSRFFGFNQSRRQATQKNLHRSRTVPLVDDRDDIDDELNSRQLSFNEVYVLTREIHHGTTSDVWESVHKTTGDRFATKIVDRRRLSARQEEQFLSEASLLNRIRQDTDSKPAGVLTLVDFYKEETHIYMVTNYVEGGDLLTRILRGPVLPEQDVLLMTRSILLGLRYLHSRNICHRNLKPQNILIESHDILADCWNAVVADFGAATRLLTDTDGDLLPLSERCATSPYSAPEILQRHPYDTQSDMWSLGVIIFHVLVGQAPFQAPTKKELFHRIVKADYSFDPRAWASISKSAKRFVASLLHADPTVRMTAVEALEHPWIRQLDERLVEGLPTQGSSSRKQTLRTKNKIKGFWKSFKSPSISKGNKTKSTDDSSLSSHTYSIMSTSDVPNSPGMQSKGNSS